MFTTEQIDKQVRLKRMEHLGNILAKFRDDYAEWDGEEVLDDLPHVPMYKNMYMFFGVWQRKNGTYTVSAYILDEDNIGESCPMVMRFDRLPGTKVVEAAVEYLTLRFGN